MDQSLIFDLDLIHRYDKAGPRYTSYPTAVQFHEGFDEAAYRRCAAQSNASGNPLSLYFHIPFCDTVCFYCACNKVATKDRSKAAPYLQRVYRELALQAELFDHSRVVDQLHWGGGTPTFISHAEMRELMEHTRRHFRLRDHDQGEYSVEIDPREATPDTIALLRELGFNRMSLGVQDFDPEVQKAVNRPQSPEQTFSVMDAARAEGFQSISIDLIYGLPKQSADSFMRTLDRVLEAMPDRLAVFNYAHLPHMFPPQRRINEAELPAPAEKLRILRDTIAHLTRAGYVYIGMDHFAKPDDELAIAQREGTLYRNFQGYSTHAHCDLIALGSTGIGKVANSYSQNLRTLDEYYQRLDTDRLAIFRGVELTGDDILRRDVITRLICNFVLDIPSVEQQYNIHFHDYFAAEWEDLAELEADGLLRRSPQAIEVQPAGKLLIRNICMVFDAYLRARDQEPRRYSKVI